MSEQDYLLIRKYFTRELTKNQVEEVEQRMISDVEFGKTVEAFGQLMRGKELEKNEVSKESYAPFDIELSERLDSHHESKESEENGNNPNTINWNSWLKVAASVGLLIIGCVWVYWSWFNVSSLDRMVMNYANEYFEVPTGRGIEEPWREHYKEKNYRNVIEILSVKEEKSNEEVFYLGLSYLYNDNYAKAVDQLSNVRLLKSNYSNHAFWYLALSYYLNNDDDEALEIWQDLSLDKENIYSEDADDALKAHGDQD